MAAKREFSYYMGNEAEQYTFYRVPKLLFTEEMFRAVSCEAKVLYGLLLDRMGLSIKNRWLDEADRVYIMFPVSKIMELLGIGTQKASKLMKELETIGLIERRRLGLGRPNIIYVKNFMTAKEPEKEAENPDEGSAPKAEKDPQTPVDSLIFPNQKSRNLKIKNQEFRESKIKSFENQNSGISQIKNQEFRKSKSNDTDINKTECNNNINNTDYPGCMVSIYPINPEEHSGDAAEGYPEEARPQKHGIGAAARLPADKGQAGQPDMAALEAAYRDIIRENISYPSLAASPFYPKQELDELVELMVDVMMLPDDAAVRIGGMEKPSQTVKGHFLKLNLYHMEYVLGCLKSQTGKIRNIKSYLLTALYNAPLTMDNYYRAEAGCDPAAGQGT